ncbi:hypothetical protein [Nocardiopsis xinjiangensis]|uniref:hypothetical protein n=1 Tax=Nocardiopsis xinjiangensis TaxID=124285 RepID=UPI000346A9E7|nr:hypothetical protein [Nocardiopsis xinjiangensis]
MAGSALAATVVVVAPAVLYPLAGVWTLLWLGLVVAVAGFLAVGGSVTIGSGRPGGPGGTPNRPGQHADGSAHVHGPAAGNETSHAYADGPVHGTRVGEVALSTAASDYELQFSAVVHWRWSGHVDLTVRNPVALAVRDVVARAAAEVARTRPRDHARTECALGAHLAVESAVTATGIAVWAEHVRLRLPDEDAERLARLSDLRKDLGLRAALQETERVHAPARAHAPVGADPQEDTERREGAHHREDAARDGGGTHRPRSADGRTPPSPAGGAGPSRRPWDGHGAASADPDPQLWSGQRSGPLDPERGPWAGSRSRFESVPEPGETGGEHDYVYLDPVHGTPEEPVFTGPEPGHDVDEYGYESYWWPAESIPDSAEEDVQVVILRGLIDAVPDRAAREEFAERQLRALEEAGHTEVARRVREGL